jgi:hypothetical protein
MAAHGAAPQQGEACATGFAILVRLLRKIGEGQVGNLPHLKQHTQAEACATIEVARTSVCFFEGEGLDFGYGC